MRFSLCTLLLVIFSLGNAPLFAQASELEQAQALVEAGDYTRAFDLLEPLEFELAGDPDFDLLFALSALKTERIGLAMLAIDRVLAQNAGSETARFLLALAYFKLDDLDSARREFDLLLSLKPVPGLGGSIDQYLDAIAAKHPAARTTWTGHVAIGLGHDTNVTGGPADDLIFFPGLDQNLALDEADREQADDYGNLSAGIDVVHRINPQHGLYAGADLSLRAYGEVESLDYDLATLRGGYRHFWGNQSIRAGLRAAYWRLDDEPYQDNDALELEWTNTFARRSQVAVAGWFNRYRHRMTSNESLDYDDSRLRVGYTRLFGERGDRLLGLSFDLGHEDDREDRADGNRDYLGLRLSGQMALDDKLSGFLLMSAQKGEYDRINPLFSEKRSESQYQLALGVTLLISEATSLGTTVVFSETNSNFELYDSSGTDFSVRLRREF